MNILYNDKTDLLYIRLDDRKQEVINKQVSEDVVVDIGAEDRIVGIEILDASKFVAGVHPEGLPAPVTIELARCIDCFVGVAQTCPSGHSCDPPLLLVLENPKPVVDQIDHHRVFVIEQGIPQKSIRFERSLRKSYHSCRIKVNHRTNHAQGSEL